MKFCSIHSETQHHKMFEALKNSVKNIDLAISPQGRRLMEAKYLVDGETVADRLYHACVAYETSYARIIRLAEYIKRGWFMFATPVLTNAGTKRGLPISCYLNYVPDSLEGLADHGTENIFFATGGGGVGGSWSDVRSKGLPTSHGSETTGIIPFLKVEDARVLAFKQGRTRSGAYAAYLDVSHPEILEFLNIRSADGGAISRKSFNIHIGVCLTDVFMWAVLNDQSWKLIDPSSREVIEVVQARTIWAKILEKRMTDRGEPYIFFATAANDNSSYPLGSGAIVHASNLCSEIMLRTDEERSAVCCLSSVNVAAFDEWSPNENFIEDLVRMLDNALEVFIRIAPPQLKKAVKSATEERSLGLGQMGLHSYLQSHDLVYGYDSHISKHIQSKAWLASEVLGRELGYPVLCRDTKRRNLHLTAVAPNSGSATMLGVSPGIEPWRANVFTEAKGALTYEVRNPLLSRIIYEIEESRVDDNNDEKRCAKDMWAEIAAAGGSVQHVDWLTDKQKAVFKTFPEINQMDLVEAASLRQRFVCQGQSLNLCFNADANPKHVNDVHMTAWRGTAWGASLKSLYYLKTVTTDKVEDISTQAVRSDALEVGCSLDATEDCSACEG